MQKLPKQQQKTKDKLTEQADFNTFLPSTTRQNSHFSLKSSQNEEVPIKIQNQMSQPYERPHSNNNDNNPSTIPFQNKKQSIYHNFQKHLVNTLKTHISFTKFHSRNKTSDKLMLQLWQYFLKSNKSTKRYLYSLLMNIPQNIIQHKNQSHDKNYHQSFRNIVKKTTHQDIKIAQNNLRLHLIQQCKELVTNGFLNNRRMHKIEEFKNYFNIFIQDLENGVLNLRIPKQNNQTNVNQPQEKESDPNQHNNSPPIKEQKSE